MACSCSEGSEGKYLIAIADPFNNKAAGAQVPDTYSFPTSTATIKETFTITPNSANCDFVVQPNLFGTLAASGSFFTGSYGSGVSGGYVNYSSAFNQPKGGFTEYGIIAQQTLVQQFARYRIVGGGVKIKVLTPTLTQQGQLYMCMVPSLSHMAWFPNESAQVSWANPYQEENPQTRVCDAGTATWYNYLEYYELPQLDQTGYVSTQIQGMPLAHTNMLSGTTLEGGVEVAFKVASPDSLKFRNANPDLLLSQNQGYNVVGPNATIYPSSSFGQGGQATYSWSKEASDDAPILSNSNNDVTYITVTPQNYTVAPSYTENGLFSPTANTFYSNPVDEDFLGNGGWSVLVFRATGLQVAVPTFSVEVVFHLEGTPQIQGGGQPGQGGYGQVQTFNSSYPPVNPHAMHYAHSVAGHVPAFKIPGKIKGHIAAAAGHLQKMFGRSGHHLGGGGTRHDDVHPHGSPALTLKSLFGHNDAGKAAHTLMGLAESAASFLA